MAHAPMTKNKKTGGPHVALLRGINLAGSNRLPMKDLAAMFRDAGCRDVRTYIQSGNVVFHANQALACRIPTLIAESIADRFGYGIPVVTRTVDELREVVRSNPFLATAVDPGRLHVVFLAQKPSAAKVATLDPERSPPDRFQVRGREVYLDCPNGVARTKLTNHYFDSRLSTVSTMRNWKTVRKLLDLAEGI